MSVKGMLEFAYHAPNTVEEAVELLAEYGSEAKVFAGGTDLLPKMKAQVLSPKHVISLKNIQSLRYLEFDEENGLRFGAAVPIRKVENFPPVKQYYPALYEGAHSIASTQIRNAGTLVGNICNAVPSADSAPGMLVLGAVLHVVSIRGKRELPIHELFTGVCKTSLAPDELVTGITIPTPAKNSANCYIPFTVRHALDLAMVSSAVNLTMEDGICKDVKIALGAVAITPKRADNAEALLMGQKLTDELIEKAAEVASTQDCSPITDLRATREYRTELVRILTRDAIRTCLR